MKVVVATSNRDKFKEISDIISDGLNCVELVPIFSFKNFIPPEENALTLKENALLKAYGSYKLTGLPSVAEDTGLVVWGLHGMPGIFSARFAGEKASYVENRKKLVELVRDLPVSKRRAMFVTVVAFIDPQGTPHFSEGCVEGFIIEDERGEGGFGYDPIFLYPPMGRTFAELPSHVKNRISHRRRAFEAIKPLIRRYACV